MLAAMIGRRQAEQRSQSGQGDILAAISAEWFAEQQAANDDTAQLRADLCSRRAGKTRGGNEADVIDASRTRHGRFLYINETRAEAKKLAWFGARGDGMASLCRKHFKHRTHINESELTIHFHDIDSWIYLVGVDDDRAIMRALGLPYHRVRWDEAQKIPTKFNETIRETLMPTLLDYGGQLRFQGTPDRRLSGIFYDITRPELEKRMPGWSVRQWSLMQNPYWGRAKKIGEHWCVVWRWDDEVFSGPHEQHELDEAIKTCRFTKGVLGLQKLLGGPDVAPLDSPVMRRMAFGDWVYEDASFVYEIHKVRPDYLTFAPARLGPDGFIDLERALADLPDWPKRDYFFALGADLGVFGLMLWAWSLQDPVLYEVGSFKKGGLDYDAHAAFLERVRQKLHIGMMTADAGGGGKQAVMGWSKKFVDRYGQPIVEATKHHKNFAIGQFNTDLVRERIRVREGGAWLEEAREHEWAELRNWRGELVEGTKPHHVLDAGLYAHRESYHFRGGPSEEEQRKRMTDADRLALEAREMEEDIMEEFLQ